MAKMLLVSCLDYSSEAMTEPGLVGSCHAQLYLIDNDEGTSSLLLC